MAEKELILDLGVEGGGARVFRSALGPDGWQFHVEGTSIYLNENDDEGWRSWHSKPVLSVEAALRSVAKDGSWVLFYPIMVHPEYQAAVWELVKSIGKTLPVERRETWKHWSVEDWKRLCQPAPGK